MSRLYSELDGNTDASLDDAAELRIIVEPWIAAAAALRSAPSNLVRLEDVLTRSALCLDTETSLQLIAFLAPRSARWSHHAETRIAPRMAAAEIAERTSMASWTWTCSTCCPCGMRWT